MKEAQSLPLNELSSDGLTADTRNTIDVFLGKNVKNCHFSMAGLFFFFAQLVEKLLFLQASLSSQILVP